MGRSNTRAATLAVVVAALGYFVDIYDLILFGIVRKPSLVELGYTGPAALTEGLFLLNCQMAGLIVGGVLWGVLGDRRGLFAGYWAVFVTVAAEQFGTNLRATVATTTPNFVRGSVVLLALGFEELIAPLGLLGAAAACGVFAIGIAVVGMFGLRETFGVDLDYVEE